MAEKKPVMQPFSFIATLFVLSGIFSAIWIALDLREHPQAMRIMRPVWILTGLWAGLPGLWVYYRMGRAKPNDTMEGMDMSDMKEMDMSETNQMKMPDMKEMKVPDMKGMDMGMHSMKGMSMNLTQEANDHSMQGMQMPEKRVGWRSAILSTLHCGAGCTLADVVGEWFFFLIPVAVGGSLVAGSWLIDYVLALLFGIGFQYAAIRGMQRSLPRREAVARAAKADVLSLTAWQVGMYVWMGIVIFGFGHGATPPRTSFWFWFMMQVAMYCGFLTALPVNVWLIRKGIKKGM